MDSDDYLYEDSLRLFIEKVEEEDLDIVYGKMKWTWFSRETFLAHLEEEKEKEAEENGEGTGEIEDGDGEHEDSDDEDYNDQEGPKDRRKGERIRKKRKI